MTYRRATFLCHTFMEFSKCVRQDHRAMSHTREIAEFIVTYAIGLFSIFFLGHSEFQAWVMRALGLW